MAKQWLREGGSGEGWRQGLQVHAGQMGVDFLLPKGTALRRECRLLAVNRASWGLPHSFSIRSWRLRKYSGPPAAATRWLMLALAYSMRPRRCSRAGLDGREAHRHGP